MEPIKQKCSQSSAFSLVEVSIASAIVIMAGLLLLLALQGAAKSTVSSRTIDDAAGMEELIRFRLREMDFADVFASLKKQNATFFAYPYQGAKGIRRSDGSLEPSREDGWVVAHGLRQSDDPLLDKDMEMVIGQVYRLRMTPFRFDSKTVLVLPDKADELDDPFLQLSVEIFEEFDLGVNDNQWPSRQRVLSFPLTIPRWK